MHIWGTVSSDVLNGTTAGDVLEGLSGNDLIRGDRGNDALFGGAGNDTLDGGGATDTLDGGEGFDTALYTANTSSVVVELGYGSVASGNGKRGFYDHKSALQIGSVAFPGFNWPTEALYGIEAVKTGSGDDILIGDQYDNLLDGGAGRDTLSGGLGSDTLVGGEGNDTAAFHWQDHLQYYSESDWALLHIDGSCGVVGTLTATGGSIEFSGTTVIDGGPKQITARQVLESIENLSTGFGDDSLFGNDRANILSGGDGNDYLSGGKGKDTLLGGAGDDTLNGGGATDSLDGGEGFDIADYSDTGVRMTVDLSAGSVSFPGNSWAPERLISIEGVITGSGRDSVRGTQEDDYLGGSGGNDTLRALGGDDTLDGGYGTDRMIGGNGSDTADYSSVDADVRIRIGAQRGEIYNENGSRQSTDIFSSIENATGGSGDDTLLGNAGINVFDGGDGNDRLDARESDDILYLSSGFDTLDGGSGIDTLVVDHSSATMSAATYRYEVSDSQQSTKLDSSYSADAYIDLRVGSADGGGLFFDTTVVRNVENVEIRGGWGDDTVVGSDADNVISVGTGTNYVRGEGGDDLIFGGSSIVEDQSEAVESIVLAEFAHDEASKTESLHGNTGNDTIYGSGRMYGGQGNDRLICTEFGSEVLMVGGGGADTFEFSGKVKGIDDYHHPVDVAMMGRVTDFDPTEGDRIAINGRTDLYGNGEDANVDHWLEGSDTIVYYANESYGNGDQYDGLLITLEDYAGPISQNDVVFI
ncbi:MAG: calcium-binding protein [Pseudomonadota bacterium]